MNRLIRITLGVAALAAVSAQPTLADGWHHHGYWGHGYWGPGVVIGVPLWAPPPPVVVYAPPPPVVYAPPPPVVYAPQPVQAVPASPVYSNTSGQYCREFQSTVLVGGVPQQSYGTACQQPDGTWRIVR